MRNEHIASIFDEYADYLELNNYDPFKVVAYRKAARIIRGLDFDIVEYIQNGGNLEKIRGVGKAIAKKIIEIVNTGSLVSLEKLKEETPEILIEMIKIPGLGPKKLIGYIKN